MRRADFIQWVRLSEQANAQSSNAYQRSVAGFAALGYLWLVGCLVLAVGLLVWALIALVREGVRGIPIVQLLLGAGLLLSSLRMLWWRMDAPAGAELKPVDSPALFEALERLRVKTKGPFIDHVLLDTSFNASISQIPRFRFFGRPTSYLTIGLPLLLALDRPRFLAVLAHEYAHQRGGRWRFGVWVYRTRQNWMKLEQGMRMDSGTIAALTQFFLRWYFPRFVAKSFAMARQAEFEADWVAGKLVGREEAGAALAEIAIKGNWLETVFWPLHWSAALRSPQPVGPFSAMRTLLAQPVAHEFAQLCMRQTPIQISSEDDTHPALPDRLDALQLTKRPPTWSTRVAFELLGAGREQWLTQFDQQWCAENARDWKLHHAYLRRVQVGIDTLTARIRRNNADEMIQLGDLRRRLDAQADVRSCYERALQITPAHPGALRGLVNCLPESEHASRIDCLGQLFELSVADRWWACRMAVLALERSYAEGRVDEIALNRWRERLEQADAAQQRARRSLSEKTFFQSIVCHDLDDFDKGRFLCDMARCRFIARAWLVRKVLPEFDWLRAYVLFLELPGMADDDRYTLCRKLEKTLELPGPLVVRWAGSSPTLQEIQRSAFNPVYVRALH